MSVHGCEDQREQSQPFPNTMQPMVGSSVVQIGGRSQEGQSLGSGCHPRLPLLLSLRLLLLAAFLRDSAWAQSAPFQVGEWGVAPSTPRLMRVEPQPVHLWKEPHHWGLAFIPGMQEDVGGWPRVCTTCPPQKSHLIPSAFGK